MASSLQRPTAPLNRRLVRMLLLLVVFVAMLCSFMLLVALPQAKMCVPNSLAKPLLILTRFSPSKYLRTIEIVIGVVFVSLFFAGLGYCLYLDPGHKSRGPRRRRSESQFEDNLPHSTNIPGEPSHWQTPVVNSGARARRAATTSIV